MSYEVLAQKWRPQSFDDVVGQTHVITTLKNQILSNRIGHAYLFWGPRGTGKTTVARLLAKAVNCPNRQHETEFSQQLTAEPCNHCEFCLEISQGRSFDVIEMDAASNRGIDPIRELRENTKLAPASCRYKIYIIDEAHMLTHEAFNALLKTLEEPPSHVIFILATTERHKIPKTIISRCQDFDFRYMEQNQIVDRLQVICDAEGIGAGTQALSLIARQSEGCLRDAENLLDRLTASAGKTLNIEQINQILGLGSSHLMDELRDAILQRDLPQSLQTLANLAKQGTDLAQCLGQLITDFRDLRLLAIDPNLGNLIEGPTSELQLLKDRAGLASLERLSRIVKILMRTSSEIKQHGYAHVHFESALIDACSIQEGIELSKILQRLSELEEKINKRNLSGGQSSSGLSSRASESGLGGFEASAGQSVYSTPSKVNVRSKSVADGTVKGAAKLPPRSSIDVKQASTEADVGENRKAVSRFVSAPSDVQNLIRDSKELAKIWQKALDRLRSERKRVLHGYLTNATLMLGDEGEPSATSGVKLNIACTPAYIVNLIEDDEKRMVASILTDLIGCPVHVDCVASSSASQLDTIRSSRKTADVTPMKLQYDAERDPELSQTLNLFEAKILKIEP